MMNPPSFQHSFFATPIKPHTSAAPQKPALRRLSASSSSSDGLAPPSSPPTHAPSSPPLHAPSSPPDRFSTADAGSPPHAADAKPSRPSHPVIAVPYSNLRKQHLAVLTTILYRSLLGQRWPRAERAFACLIRGKDVDVRRLWGVGLQLLLRREGEGQGQGEWEGEGKREGKAEAHRVAVEYMERLVLFYPYRPRLHSHHPAVVARGEQTGAAAEEREVGGKGKGRGRGKLPPKKARAEAKAATSVESRLPPYPSAVEFNPALFALLIEGSRFRSVEGPDEAEAEAEAEVSRPEKIKERLEELMLTPPWSDMVGLLCLRGMVCLWIADIEEDGGVRERARELRREARGHFGAVLEKGGTLPEGITGFLEEDEEDEEMVDV
ncbi:RNA polymerase I-specific initiation factor-domain-containing protein [Tricharina praecox]|uniref:RNA polymerase I-specific initiation factor-domain-containing protein n=1 Tax=Tricharina praecox TaxID=43433 RepID=UPI002220499B|nr:RNA polymerase I-specific initiation factor-domain-containing protein [Tricharina praecox]KAI5848841.1 RNA polymerase I-specific initiation factor-domain-containing protein [Tricharina praecox]